MLQAETIRTARCLRVVLSKLLAARCWQSKFFISARAPQKIAVLTWLANARKDHPSPLVQLIFPVKYNVYQIVITETKVFYNSLVNHIPKNCDSPAN